MTVAFDVRPSFWEALWFTPRSAGGLVIVRLIVFGTATLVLESRIRAGIPAAQAALQDAWEPVSFIGLLGFPPPSETFGAVAWPLGLVLSGVAALGWGGRWVQMSAGLLTAYLLTLINCFGKINHGLNVLVMGLFLMAAAPAVPSLLRFVRESKPVPVSWRYAWPVVGLRVGFALMFSFAALSKLRASGLEWVTSENLRNVLVQETFLRSATLSAVAEWLAAEPWRWKAAAGAALLAEAGLILAVLAAGWVRVAAVAMAAGLVLGMNLTMDLGGWANVLLIPVFIDWEALSRSSFRRWLVPLSIGGGLAWGTGAYLIHPAPVNLSRIVLMVAVGATGAHLLRRESIIEERHADRFGLEDHRS